MTEEESSWSKRNRTTNYSKEEKNLLLQLVNKYKHIIENKKTDAHSNADKEKIWIRLANEFNSISTNGVRREANSLKKAYINMKKTVRKQVADEKISILKTGGGPPSPIKDDLKELTLATMNKKTVFGLSNKFDSDSTYTFNDEQSENINGTVVEKFELEEEDAEYIMIQTENPRADITRDTTLDIDEAENSTWTKWTPQMLTKPLSQPLQKVASISVQKKMVETAENIKLPSRRRPATAAALHSSEVAKIYCKLGEEQLEVVKLQRQILENRLQNEKLKSEMENKILDIELRIKQKTLGKI